MKVYITSIIAMGLILSGAIILSSRSVNNQDINFNNVSIVDGKQIIEINVKGGYKPERSVAKSGLPTIIRFKTSGTFDCSASIKIPSKNISVVLPQTGSTDVDIGIPTTSVLKGICSMGMYSFEINFQT